MSTLNLPPLILVVDDDPMMGLICTRTLERLGVQVILCDSAGKAAQEAEHHSDRIKLLLVDMALGRLRVEDGTPHPETDGGQLLSLLELFCPEAISVHMSGYTRDELDAHGYQLETEHFIQKPFPPARLRTFVQQLLPDLKVPDRPILPATDITWTG